MNAKIKQSLKRTLCIALVILMAITSAPLGGFVGLKLPGFGIEAEAAYDNTISSYNYPLRKIADNGRGFSSEHGGVDLTISKGTPVYSAKNGTVKIVYSGCKNYNGASSNGQDCEAKGCTQNKTYMNGSGYKAGHFCNGGFGNGVVVENDDGKFCYYAHLNSISVKKGDKVTPNTKLGEVGSSGCSTGAHLHFAVTNKATSGTAYNPFKYIFPGFKIMLSNNGSNSVNPKFTIYFPWKEFEFTKCQINFGTSASSMSSSASYSNKTAQSCSYNLGSKFGNLTKGKTYYIKVSVTKGGTTFSSKTFSFVAGSGDKTFLDYSTVVNPNVSVTFNGNGGTPSSTSESFVVGQIHGDTMPSATREGYTFDGWYASANGGTRVTRSTTVTSGNKTYYAHWIKNQTDVLKVGHVYRIYNENSGLVLAADGVSNGSLVCQRNIGDKGNGELWRVTYADENGYYKFESLNGCSALDLDADDKWAFGASLQVYEQKDHDAQKFSIIKRGDKSGYSGVYSIHSKNNGRAIDISGKSTEAGGKVHSWDYHGGTNQLFYFEEITSREITFYDNLNGNYIVSPREEYEHIGSTTPTGHYSSRNTEYVTVSLDPENDSLLIKSLKAGSSGKDLKFYTTINGSYNYDFEELNDSTMILHFKAKSSCSGAKIYFRWGYDSVTYPVELTTEWEDYEVELPRTKDSGNNIHPYIDKVCTIEMSDIALFEKDTEGYIGDNDAYTAQVITVDVYDEYSCVTPMPAQENLGCVFDGWYTKRIGGTKVADAWEYYDVSNLVGDQKLYAQWVACVHYYEEVIVLEPTHISEGIKQYFCDSCGDSYTESIDKLAEHSYSSKITVEATCEKNGVMTFTCACGDIYTETIDRREHVDNDRNDKCDLCAIQMQISHIHSYKVSSVVPASCETNGYTTYTCDCGEHYTADEIPATGHVFDDDDENCQICGYDRTDDCSCNCHKSGIAKFFFNIILFFQKLFGMNEECSCGVCHY